MLGANGLTQELKPSAKYSKVPSGFWLKGDDYDPRRMFGGGAVRYSIVGEPVIQLYCYCTDCRRVSGTDGYAAYVVQRSDLTLDQGRADEF